MDKGTGNFSFKTLWQSYRDKPAVLWVMAGLLVLGVMLLMGGGNETSNVSVKTASSSLDNSGNSNIADSEEQRLEKELAQTLERMAGVGRVRVELTLKSGNRRVWERQTKSNKRVSQEQSSVTTEEDNSDELVMGRDHDGHDAPILKASLAPEIEGVVVVAEGANDMGIRETLTQTVMTILGLPAHRVLVIPGKPGKEGQS